MFESRDLETVISLSSAVRLIVFTLGLLFLLALPPTVAAVMNAFSKGSKPSDES